MEEYDNDFNIEDDSFFDDIVVDETESETTVREKPNEIEKGAPKKVAEKQKVEKPIVSANSGATEEMLMKRLESITEQQAKYEQIIASQNEMIQKLMKANESATKYAGSSNGGNADVTAQLAELLREMNQQQSVSKLVKVINLMDCAQCQFETTPGTYITFNRYGQSFPVSEMDAEILLNRYYQTFENGGLTFDADHLYILKEKGLDVDKINYHPLETIEKANTMSVEELKRLFFSISSFQREMFKLYIVKQLNAGKKFLSSDKVRLLNKWSKQIYVSNVGGYETIISMLEKSEDESNE